MKLRSIVTVLAIAAATAALTIAVASHWVAGTAQAGPAVKPSIVQPELDSQGCKFVLKTDKESYDADERPVIEVTATNPTSNEVNVTVSVQVSAMAPVSPMSRMLPLPNTLWTQEYAFSLSPEQTKSQRITCTASLPAGQNVRIILSDKKNAVLTNELATQRGGTATKGETPNHK